MWYYERANTISNVYLFIFFLSGFLYTVIVSPPFNSSQKTSRRFHNNPPLPTHTSTLFRVMYSQSWRIVYCSQRTIAPAVVHRELSALRSLMYVCTIILLCVLHVCLLCLREITRFDFFPLFPPSQRNRASRRIVRMIYVGWFFFSTSFRLSFSNYYYNGCKWSVTIRPETDSGIERRNRRTTS